MQIASSLCSKVRQGKGKQNLLASHKLVSRTCWRWKGGTRIYDVTCAPSPPRQKGRAEKKLLKFIIRFLFSSNAAKTFLLSFFRFPFHFTSCARISKSRSLELFLSFTQPNPSNWLRGGGEGAKEELNGKGISFYC